MRKAIAILLIPFLLIGQGVGIAHVHAGSDSDRAGEHAARPHAHLHGGHAHSHGTSHSHAEPVGFASETEAEKAVGDGPGASDRQGHDSDAVYGAGATAATHRKNLVDDCGALIAVAMLAQTVSVGLLPSENAAAMLERDPPDDPNKCPLYLRIRFIRC